MSNIDAAELHVLDLYDNLITLMGRGLSPESASGDLMRTQERLFARHPDLLEERLHALQVALDRVREQQNRVMFLQKKALTFSRAQWYLGPTERDSLWAKLAARLTAGGRDETQVKMVHEDSNTIVGLLDNPTNDMFSTRGLVVGHVQSGKTGNIAAVINKAAETPFKFFLVLSGVTDQLRNQTQVRLDQDVVGLDPERWMCWTAADSEVARGEFAERAVGGFSFDHRNQLAVVKKNAAVLRRFLAKLKNTSRSTLQHTPFFIIDDECDQASVNSARLDNAVTAINRVIRQILAELPRVAYVGYTATPFANILIDTTVEDDLYPRHFIHALKRPKDYFGAEELFGRHALEGEYDEGGEGLSMIRVVPQAEAPQLRSRGTGDVQITGSLQEAVRYFVMVAAARIVRGQPTKNNSMLVHTSVLNSVHRRLEHAVNPFVENLSRALAASNADLLDMMRVQWEREQAMVLSEQFDLEPLPFGRLQPLLADVAASLRVHVENWQSVERLDYSNGPHNLIIIGGNVLARGLTLDGLSVSYFLRSSSQYDTLMQMGRWFGYRPGFADLPRIWMEESVRDAFFDLATIEAEIRRDIDRYAAEDVTPEQFAVRIRRIPGMTITAPAKMRKAVDVQIGYAGTHVQTFRFYHDREDLLRANWAHGADLIDAISDLRQAGEPAVFRDVPVKNIIHFLERYGTHETHRNLAPAFLVEYIRKGLGDLPQLAHWNVAVVEADGGASRLPLGSLGNVRRVTRSAESHASNGASIKALMSRKDLLIDLGGGEPAGDRSWDALKATREKARANPLLLLYPIQDRSEPRAMNRQNGNGRSALNAMFDVLGYGLVFPGNRELSGKYVAANIRPDQAEAEEELASEDRIPDAVLEGADVSPVGL